MSAESEAQEALMFALDSIKSGMFVLTERVEAIEQFLHGDHHRMFRAADTDYIGNEFREKWAHMLEEK